MLYYGVIKRFPKVLILQTSGIKEYWCAVWWSGVGTNKGPWGNRQWFMVWAHTKVLVVGAKVHDVGKPTSDLGDDA
jgi:hypothetical protein